MKVVNLSLSSRRPPLTTPITFDALRSILSQRMAQLPEHRKGSNTQYRIQDAALGALGIFFMQASSFWDDQRHLQYTKGHNKACTLFGLEQIPWDNQRRTLLDPIPPWALDGVFLEVFEGLEPYSMGANFRGLKDQRRIALEGTQYFSSTPLHGHNCLRRQTSQGQTLSSHPAVPPVIVCPGRAAVVAVPPESLMPQDGHDTQDGERAAGAGRSQTKTTTCSKPRATTSRTTLVTASETSRRLC
jgi:hypothetical protein